MLEMSMMLLAFISLGVFCVICAVLFDSTPMLSPDDV